MCPFYACKHECNKVCPVPKHIIVRCWHPKGRENPSGFRHEREGDLQEKQHKERIELFNSYKIFFVTIVKIIKIDQRIELLNSYKNIKIDQRSASKYLKNYI